VKIGKIIQRRIRAAVGGTNIESDVNAAVAANVGERGGKTQVRSTQRASASSQSRPDESPPG
jgi:hypothetical protein